MRLRIFSFLLAGAAAFLGTSAMLPASAAEVAASQATRMSSLDRDEFDAWVRFKADAAKSSDLRVRIALSASELDERDGLFYVAPDAMLESLIEQARGSTDPIVLWLLASRCSGWGADHRRRCDPVAIAERWTVADTQNQVAWLTLADALNATGRPVEAREALLRGSRASMWREYQVALGRAVAADVPTRGMTPRQRLSMLEMAQTTGFANLGPFSTLGGACRDTTLRDVCLRYLDTMARDADNLMALRIVAVYSARAGASADVVTARSRKADAYLYAIVKQRQEDDGQDVDLALRRLQDRLASSEAARASRYLADAHLSEEEGARRFSAQLTDEQRRVRAETVRPKSSAESGSGTPGS